MALKICGFNQSGFDPLYLIDVLFPLISDFPQAYSAFISMNRLLATMRDGH